MNHPLLEKLRRPSLVAVTIILFIVPLAGCGGSGGSSGSGGSGGSSGSDRSSVNQGGVLPENENQAAVEEDNPADGLPEGVASAAGPPSDYPPPKEGK